jgi:5-methylcytosine-specific restriction enzyme subunit McrC
MKCFSTKEHDSFKDENLNELKKLNLDFSKKENEVKFLGLCPFAYKASYYVGIDWLKENENYIAVSPKIENLDYVKMFARCLKHPEISKHIGKIYGIDFEKKQIEIQTSDWDLTPFLIVHFLSIVERILKQGLKSNYIVCEENLKSKIKGKIVFSRQIKNIIAKRSDRIFCRFQEYSKNCLENRLLKKALLFSQRYLTKSFQDKYPDIISKQNRILSAFRNIDADISYSEIQSIKVNALYKDYIEAVGLAKKILRYFGYSYKKAEAEKKALPPFWIDMSKLFELYVYDLLRDEYGSEILFQAHVKYGYVDFLKKDERLIIDTKYKKLYDEDKKYEIEDIRQLSAYARDKGALKKLNVDENIVVDCVIIYPAEDTAEENFNGRKLKEYPIEQFTKFYKCAIRLPIKE